jgi:hypothetical protein
MKMKDYCVRIGFGGSREYSVSAPDYEEAEDLAHELFYNELGDIGEDVEIHEITSEPDGE